MLKKSAALLEKTHKFNELICCVSIFVKKYLWLCWRTRHREPRIRQRLAKLQQLNLCIIYLCTKIVKKSNYTNCIYFDRETISLKWCNLHVSVNYNKNLLFSVWCRKDKFWILFFLSTFVLFSVKGSVVSLFAPAIIPDSESDTEGSTRTMRLLKLHYHQQQVSNWSLFCTIFETNKQTRSQY